MKLRYPYRMQRRSWMPAMFTTPDMMLILYVAITQAMIRSFDYGTGHDGGNRALSLVESSAPLDLWSAGFGIGVLILLFGRLERRHLFVWLGHGWLAIAYSALALGIALPTLGHPPWFDGIRSAGVLLLPAVLHWKFCTRTGSTPVTPEQQRPTGQEIGQPKC